MNYKKGEKYLNSILNRILLINSFQNPRLKSILAAANEDKAANWDSSKSPKMGTAVFPGQDNEILLKLMKLVPYMTYDNFISALKAKSRLNHEKTKNELYEFFNHIYNDLQVQANQVNTDIVDNDNYSVDDIDALDFVMHKVRRNTNKRYEDKKQALEDALKDLQKAIAKAEREFTAINNRLAIITTQINKMSNPNATNINNSNENDIENDIDSKEFADKFVKELSKLKNRQNNEDEDTSDEDTSNKVPDYEEVLTQQLKQIHDSGDQSEQTQAKKRILENELRKFRLLISERNQITRTSLVNSREKINELIKQRKQLKKDLRILQEQGSPFDRQIRYTLSRYNDNSNIFDEDMFNNQNTQADAFTKVIDKIKIKIDETDKELKKIDFYMQQLATNNIDNIPEDERKSMEEYNTVKQVLEQKISDLNKKIVQVKNDREKRRKTDTRALLHKLIDNGLYEQYCPYAYACEFIQNKCGKVANISDTIKVNQSPTYQYNKLHTFQQALNILSNAMPSIYREIIDDIYDKYSRYPAFNKDFDPTNYQYNNIQVVTYTPTKPGEGNYTYDDETKTYIYDENGNFTREIKPLNAHTQFSMPMPMDRYEYDESTKKYKLNPKGDYIYIPAKYKYSYDSTTNQYKQDARGDYMQLPSGEYQKISNGNFHKVSKDMYKRVTVLENNNNFRHQLEQSFGSSNNYIFKQVESGKGNYIYNATTKRYEYAPEGGNFVRVQSDNSSNKNDSYFADGRILSFTRQLVKKQYYNKDGYIDPIIVTYLREKYANVEDTKENVNHFLYDLKNYVKWIKMIDDADPKKDIIDDQWKNKFDNFIKAISINNAQLNADKITLAIIGKYVKANSNEFINEQLYNRNVNNIDRINNLMNSNPTTNMKIVAKYDYDIYKNFHKKIDPIMITWAEYYHKYNAQREDWYKRLNTIKQQLMKTKQEFNNRVQNLKNNIMTDINNLSIDNNISEIDKKRFIKQMLGIDIASIRNETIDKDYRLAQIQQLHNKYENVFENLFKEFDKEKDKLYQTTLIDRTVKLNQIVNAFIDHVNFFGDMLAEVKDNDKLGVTRALIENPANWQRYLNQMVRVIQARIDKKSYKNFNVAYCIDLLENMINKYGGAKKDYNPVNEDNYKDIPELNIQWTRANITYELNKIFESAMT